MTDRYTIFGNPVAHSMSPVLHPYFAKVLGEDLEYGRTLVEPGAFAATAAAFFASGGCGANVTVPCKVDACNFCQELTPYAKEAGAVNTMKALGDGQVLGDNTDGRGFIEDLHRLGAPLQGARVLVMGAGGAARGILGLLAREGVSHLALTNRSAERAVELARTVSGVEVVPDGKASGHYDLIVNATSSSLLGILPNLSDQVLGDCAFAYDLMYSKDGNTTFTRHAEDLGVGQVADGYGMLILQAVLGFELWRGKRPDTADALRHFRPDAG